ncbi:MAG TPA: HAMP domain-containing sensor histidine kinase [Deltaproteobacteria bacterium]|nr:HAMP domain-containing sensor histidine kinase [Deltaproteobacteria bacterium]HQB38746.1 HAMP domain-containing sensor histidine kinase [Deltaproteobacteria bacterium]
MTTGYDDMQRELSLLRERNHYLEDCNQRYFTLLDVLASSRDFQDELVNESGTRPIFRATFQQLRRLLPFSGMAFLVNDEDNSFDLVECVPQSSHQDIELEVDERIFDGSFAWALNHNHPVIMPSSHADRILILQVLATKTRVRGMFAGLLPGCQTAVDVPTLNALASVLLNTAYAMESVAFKQIINDNMYNLEQKVDERTRELQEAIKRADAANLAKSAFLANMSHELRTPLNAIIGFGDILLGQSVGPLNEIQQEYLGYVFQSSKHLLELINDILDLSKVEADKMELHISDADIVVLLKNSLTMLKEMAAERNVQLGLDISPALPAVLRLDERKLKQVMYNLLSNAVKFTPGGGNILVRVSGGIPHALLPEQAKEQMCDSAAQTGDYLQISVKDSGIGLSEDNLERIFRPFEQADNSTTREFEGTGLGLTLCKRLLELHHGTIWAASDGPGLGSAFTLVLPLVNAKSARKVHGQE